MNVDSDYVDAATVGHRSASGPTPAAPGAPHKKPAHKPPAKKPPARKPSRRHHHARKPHRPTQPSNPTGNGALVRVRGAHSVYRIVGGAPLLIRHWEDIGGRQPVRQLSVKRFHALRAVPVDGTLLYTITGTAYRIAGGFPFTLTEPGNRRSGAELIDLWDIRHLSNPKVHLHAVPSNGTVVQAAPSGNFWAFEHGRLFPSRHRQDAISIPDVDLGSWLFGCPAGGESSGGTGVGRSCWAGNGSPSGSHSGGGGLAADS
jgi:hypothetical protein